MRELLGQGHAFQRCLRQARQLEMHHGMILAGGRGLGKSLAAEHLAAAVLCSSALTDRACGACIDCQQLARHPDLQRLELPEDGAEIPVEQVRELRERLLRLPVRGRARVAILDPADRLNLQGQNALLKTLEEPGRDTFLLLPTRRPEALLETVRSRLGSLPLRPLGEGEIARSLALGTGEGGGSEALARVAALARGSLGLAQDLLQPEFQALDQLLQAFLGGQGSPVATARACLQGLSGRRAVRERARMALFLLAANVREELLTVLATENTGPYAPGTSVRWIRQIESLFAAEGDLDWHIPPEQVLAGALLSLGVSRDEAPVLETRSSGHPL